MNLIRRYYVMMLLVPAFEIFIGQLLILVFRKFEVYTLLSFMGVVSFLVIYWIGAAALFYPIRNFLMYREDPTAARNRLCQLSTLAPIWVGLCFLGLNAARYWLLPAMGVMTVSDRALANAPQITFVQVVFSVFLVKGLIEDYVVSLKFHAFQSYQLTRNGGRSKMINRLLWLIMITAFLPGLLVLHFVTVGDNLQMIRREVIGVAASSTLAIGIAVYVILRSIRRPIWLLMQSLTSVETGRLETAVPVTTDDEIGVLTASVNDMIHRLRQRDYLFETFGTVKGRQIEMEMVGQEGILEAQAHQATVLIVDLDNFKAAAKGLSPRSTMELLAAAISLISEQVRRHDGIAVNVVGDRLYTAFGLPLEDSDHVAKAVKAASDIHRELDLHTFSEGRKLTARIGISTGSVIAGLVGRGGNIGYTVIGRAVTQAGHFERVGKKLGHKIVMALEALPFARFGGAVLPIPAQDTDPNLPPLVALQDLSVATVQPA